MPLARWSRVLIISLLAGSFLTTRHAGEAASSEATNLSLVSVGERDGEAPETARFEGASSDGSRIFFTTVEKLTSDDNDASDDVYERSGGHTVLVSVSERSGQASQAMIFGRASDDGTRIFFTTTEKLTSDDGDTVADVYEGSGGDTRLVSVSERAGETPLDAVFAGASSDGSRVFFTTDEKLTTNDSNAVSDIYERRDNDTRLVSVSEKIAPTLQPVSFAGSSSDGTRVFFTTTRKMTADDSDARVDVYERSGGDTQLVSRSERVGETPADAFFFGASSDGGRVFLVTSEKLTAEDGDTAVDIYERSGGDTLLVSVGENSVQTLGDQGFAGASSDGLHVFFQTNEKLTENDTDTRLDVYERSGGHTRLVSVSEKPGETAADAVFSGTSSDGLRVFFTTTEKLTPGDGDSVPDVYERSGGHTRLVSVGEVAGQPAQAALFSGVSGDGLRVFFTTLEKLTAEDADPTQDVYERSGGDTRLVSVSQETMGTTQAVHFQSASSDGTRVFLETVDQLTEDDGDAEQDVYEATAEAAGFAEAASSIGEDAGTAPLNVVLARAAGAATVDYAITGGSAGPSDRTLAAGTLEFDAGETSKDIVLVIEQDDLVEIDETVVITLRDPIGTGLSAAKHTLTIVDDDATVGFKAATSAAPEATGVRNVPVSLTRAVTKTVTVGYLATGGTAINGRDYVLAGGELSFAPGQTTRTIAVLLRQDFLVESPETITLQLLSPSGARPGALKHTLTITDDEPRLKCGGRRATIVGTNAADTIAGTAAADVIVGRGGRDAISGKGGADVLCGSGGDDAISGGSGNDAILGGFGNDALRGEGGRDSVKGQGGKDRLSGGQGGGDACDGGPGVDALLPKAGCETVAGIP